MQYLLQGITGSYLLLVLCANVQAGEADVEDAIVKKTRDDIYHISVTLRHDDTGWEHYANRWEALETGCADTEKECKVLATRVLYHPHVSEQPFTRSLGDVKIPAGIKKITLRGHDLVHGYGGKTMDIEVPE